MIRLCVDEDTSEKVGESLRSVEIFVAIEIFPTPGHTLSAGADGLALSRKYSEMRLANLEAAGRAVREFKG